MLAASDADAEEAILVRDGLLSEGGSSNVLLVKDGTVITPPVDDEPSILHGTVREVALDAARATGLRVEVRRVRAEELTQADEIVVASSRRILASVTHVDGVPFRDARPGPVARTLLAGVRASVGATMASAPRR